VVGGRVAGGESGWWREGGDVLDSVNKGWGRDSFYSGKGKYIEARGSGVGRGLGGKANRGAL
jgi:hypothetical protein